jgi:HEPN domain-containing protein
VSANQSPAELTVKAVVIGVGGLETRHALAELLGKRDNDVLRPADVG